MNHLADCLIPKGPFFSYVIKLDYMYVRTEAFDRLLAEDVCKIHKHKDRIVIYKI